MQLLARARASEAPAILRRSTQLAFQNRWWAQLSVAAQDTFAASLLDDGPGAPGMAAEETPPLGDVLTEGRLLEGPPASRMPIGGA